MNFNETHGDQRFGQLLVNCDVTVDTTPPSYPYPGEWHPPRNEVLYAEEPEVTLARVVAAIERMG